MRLRINRKKEQRCMWRPRAGQVGKGETVRGKKAGVSAEGSRTLGF